MSILSPRKAVGRECGECSMCCKVFAIPALNKPIGEWCIHCRPGRERCTIYPTRPDECASFHCSWMASADLGPEWYPPVAKFVVSTQEQPRRVCINVDAGSPHAWRREPYYSRIKLWAKVTLEQDGQLVVYVRNSVILVLPSEEIDLNTLPRGVEVKVGSRTTPNGREWAVFQSNPGAGPDTQWVKVSAA
jgi:hypothetical protein